MAYASRQSSAYQEYDLPREKRELKTISTPKTRPLFRAKSLATIMIVLAVATVIVHSQMTLTQLTTDIGAANQQIEDLKAENIALQVKQTNALSGEAVDQYATERLGMVKLDGSQIEYVEMSNPDRIETEKTSGTAGGALGGLVSYFSAILEYLG